MDIIPEERLAAFCRFAFIVARDVESTHVGPAIGNGYHQPYQIDKIIAKM